MKVRELIEALQRCDPDDPVKVWGHGTVVATGRKTFGERDRERPFVVIADRNDPSLILPFAPPAR